MGLFTKPKPSVEWVDAGVPPIEHGDLSLHEDGSFWVGPFPFSQEAELRHVQLCDAKLIKLPGPGQVLTVSLNDGRMMFFKYEGSRWLVLRRAS